MGLFIQVSIGMVYEIGFEVELSIASGAFVDFALVKSLMLLEIPLS